MYQVRDGARTLQFNGVKLGESTSKRRDSARWIEFKLYKTDAGSYILSRVGVSLVFHSATCPLVQRYGLHEMSPYNLSEEALPCDECYPTRMEPLVYPEQYRYWTLVSDEPEAVLDALYRYDDGGARYLTKVAEKVLQQAAQRDSDLDRVYHVEYIA